MCNSDLAVVELLDDGFTLLADITDANEFGLTVTLEETTANTLDHGSSRATTGNTAVLNVPEDPHWRDVLGTTVLWRPILLANLAEAGRWHVHHAIRGGATAIANWDWDRSSLGHRNIWPSLV